MPPKHKKVKTRFALLIGFSFVIQLILFGQSPQQTAADTLRVEVTAFGQYRPVVQSHPSIHLLRGADLDRFNRTSFLQSLNTLPGLRMEERSPGSYRINIRGSSLRSPFGVRNTKVYYNGLPLTDAGGNTYFNQLAFYNIASMEIAKGPGGSMYGAGTGGVILLNNLTPKKIGAEMEISTGSFGLFQAMVHGGKFVNKKYRYAGAGITTQDGYRDHTKMVRANMNYSGEWVKKEKITLLGHILAAILQYQTPGGLTKQEFIANPRQARPRVGALPSAQEAKAAINQKNIMAGISSLIAIAKGWKNETGIYGQYNQVNNPAIRNYEERHEPGWGARSVFTHNNATTRYHQQLLVGGEVQYGDFNTRVFTNNSGEKGNIITHDDLTFFTWNGFIQWQRQYGTTWDLSAGISYFQNRVRIKRLFPIGNEIAKKDYLNDWAPRFSAIYRPNSQWQLSALLSRGFSSPTVSELLPSTGEINTRLRPEYGWNVETGLRFNPNKNVSVGINGFRFDLMDALVQRRDSTGADFYTNAGSTRQQGIEAFAEYLFQFGSQKKVNVIQAKAAYTFSNFFYTQYIRLTDNFSGNRLPSVPNHAFSLTTDARWSNSLFLSITFYSASFIWLNDANTEKADPYQLLGLKIGYGKKWQVFFGIDNIFNEVFSLGNDINAFGGRYFNVAPLRNFYVGIRRQLTFRP